jgi:hypothetical protein
MVAAGDAAPLTVRLPGRVSATPYRALPAADRASHSTRIWLALKIDE